MRLQEDDAVSPVIGVVMMVAITLVLASVAFVLFSELGGKDVKENPPRMVFSEDGSSLILVGAPDSASDWSEFSVNGCDAPTGSVRAGDALSACSGRVTIVHLESNQLLYEGEF